MEIGGTDMHNNRVEHQKKCWVVADIAAEWCNMYPCVVVVESSRANLHYGHARDSPWFQIDGFCFGVDVESVFVPFEIEMDVWRE